MHLSTIDVSLDQDLAFIHVVVRKPDGNAIKRMPSMSATASCSGLQFRTDPLGNLFVGTIVHTHEREAIQDGELVDVDGDPLELDGDVTVSAFTKRIRARSWLRRQRLQ